MVTHVVTVGVSVWRYCMALLYGVTVTVCSHCMPSFFLFQEFNGEDTYDLFLEEREAEIQAAQTKKKSVPGMVNPHELEEEEMR